MLGSQEQQICITSFTGGDETGARVPGGSYGLNKGMETRQYRKVLFDKKIEEERKIKLEMCCRKP